MDNKELAKKILQEVGGEENISHLTHCATRIRMNLKDDDKANLKTISNLEGVLKAQNQNGQTQVIIGAKVASVYEELKNITNINTSDGDDGNTKKSKKSISNVIETIAGIFSPVIPMLIACGLLKAFTATLVNFEILAPDTNIVKILTMLGDLVFYFLPFFLAVSAAKKFKTNEYIALGLAAAYMYPTIIDGARAAAETGVKTLDLFGLPILLVDYKSTVIPIILSVWVMSFVYKKIDKVVPDFLKIILTAMIVVIIMVPLELIVLGPIGSYLGVWLADFIRWFYDTGGVFSAFLLGATRSLLTLLGMHYALAPLQIQEIADSGSSYILVSALTANMAQAGAALGVFLAIKNKGTKSLAASASFSAFLGITEPAMFGVNLRYKRPFFIALGASGISAVFLSLFNTSATAYVPPSLLTLPVFQANSFVYIIIGIVISAAIACIVTYFFGIPKDMKDEGEVEENKDSEVAVTTEESVVRSPIIGTAVDLSKVNDAVFSQGIMGKGVAIVPSEGRVLSPFDGRIEVLYGSKHAIGLKSNNGIEVLIHVGIDTVNLGGKFYESKVEQGQDVKKGDLLLEFDINAIKNEGYEIITPVIITNSDSFSNIDVTVDNKVTLNDVVITLN